MTRLPRTQPRSRATGAALIIGLILLLIMTLLAVAGMSGATLQLVMSGNVQYSQQAFQAAETGIESEIAAGGFTSTLNRSADYDIDTGLKASTTTKYQVSTTVPAGGYSIGAGFQAHHFEVKSIGTAPRDAKSTHIQGFYVVGPG